MNKKITSLLTAALLAISLCGCGGDIKSSDSADKSPGTSSADPGSTNSIPYYPVPDDATFLKGAAGDVIGLSEIVEARDLENREISPQALTEDNFFSAVTDSAYCALPLYNCLTDRESEYDEASVSFMDAPQDNRTDFIKVKKGDKLLGLTVAEASSEFGVNSPVFGTVTSTALTLEGEITLTGYARVIPGDEYGVAVGDIVFIPVGNVQLPAVRLDSCGTDGVITRRTGDVYIMNGSSADDSIVYTNEYADRFVLDNINSTSADVGCLSEDGSFTKVNVTISGIGMKSTINWITQISADIVSISAAD